MFMNAGFVSAKRVPVFAVREWMMDNDAPRFLKHISLLMGSVTVTVSINAATAFSISHKKPEMVDSSRESVL